ncbi:MAG TPA: ATP-binding protein, partial [Gemmataceae bacterium]
ANLREWLNEARVFRKTLPDLVREYLALHDELGPGVAELEIKRQEIEEHLSALAEPTRVFPNLLPLFPDVYRIEVRCFPGPEEVVLAWDSPVPRPRSQPHSQVHTLEYPVPDVGGERAVLRCEYHLHAFSRLQQTARERQMMSLAVVGLVVTAGVVAAYGVYRFLRRERQHELGELQAQATVDRAQKQALENELRRQEAERQREELDRKLLEQSLEAARQESRASQAERAALELKSQLYASIGIMAGSYAHNIKNLLVRPNDLLSRCLEADGIPPDQQSRLREVKHTLGTVTERLQEILRTVRHDPSRTERTRLDLNRLPRELVHAWADMARDRWKLNVHVELSPEPLWVEGDPSHLQQAVENLLFNARDATFEMRNHLREQAYREPDPARRRGALLEAAGWKGSVWLRTYRDGGDAVLEVRDDGIGMSEEVRRKCLDAHFSTKRDNALYEGYNAGTGLGLSFVTVVLEHHGAKLEIESEPLKGALFRVRFPLAEGGEDAGG